MPYSELLLDRRFSLILPLYNDGKNYPSISREEFYRGNFARDIGNSIVRQLRTILVDKDGVVRTKSKWPVKQFKVEVVPESDNFLDMTMTSANVLLNGSMGSGVENLKDIDIIVNSMIFKNRHITTTVGVFIAGSPIEIEPGSSLLSLNSKDKEFMAQFGRFSEQLITYNDLFDALQKPLGHENKELIKMLTHEIAYVANSLDLFTFQAFGREKAVDAIIQTSLPN